MIKISKIGIIIGVFFVLFSSFLGPVNALAQSLIGNSSNADPLGVSYPAASGLTDADPRITTAKILRVAMSLLGTIFFFITIYGGYEWMTAAGNDEKVGQAKKRIYTGIIGLLIILSSYSIAYFVIVNLTNASISGSAPSIR